MGAFPILDKLRPEKAFSAAKASPETRLFLVYPPKPAL